MDDFYVDRASVGSWNDELLVLMYHHVGTPPLFKPLRGLYVEPELLRTQWRELRERDVRFDSLDRALERPSRRVAVTFDDGSRSLLTRAVPILIEFQVPAITYIVADRIGRTNEWDRPLGAKVEPLMDRAELLAWMAAGGEVGSHGLTHRDLTTLEENDARREIVDSRKKLEDLLGRAVYHFCYPYGRWTPPLRQMVIEAGYQTAVSTDPGLNGSHTDPYALSRFLARHLHPGRVALRTMLESRARPERIS